MPFDDPSCRVGVGSVPVVLGVLWAVPWWALPGEQEYSFAAVWGSDVGGADATPERVIPCFGQVAEYTVESAAFPAKRGDVLHHDPVDCTIESIIHSGSDMGDLLTV
jgi:hypothetical protein